MSQETIDIVVHEAGSQDAAKHIAGVGDAADKAKPSVDHLSSSLDILKTTLETLGLAMTLKSIVDMTQSYIGWQNALKQSTDSAAELAVVQDKLFAISQKTFTAMGANTSAYNEFETALKNTSHSAQDTLDIIQNLQSFFTASGTSAETAAGLMQSLATGMQSGTVAGRPLMSVMKESKDLALAMATALGVTVPRFKEMADAGQITTDKLVSVLTSTQLAGAGTEALAKHQVTLANALNNVKNSFTDFIGKVDQSNNVSGMLANGILSISKNIGPVVAGLEMLAAAYIAFRVVAVASMIAVEVSTFAATIAAEGLWAAMTGGLSLLIPILAAGITWILNFGQAIKLTEDGSVTLRGAVVGTFNYIIDVVSRAVQWVMNLKQMFLTLYPGSVLQQLVNGFVDVYNSVIAVGRALVTMYQGSLLQEVINDVRTAAAAFASLWNMVYQGSILQEVINAIADKFAKLKNFIVEAAIALGLMSRDGKSEMQKLGDAVLDASRTVPVLKEQFSTLGTQVRDDMAQATKGTVDWMAELQKLMAQSTATANSATADFARMAAAASSTSAAISQMQQTSSGGGTSSSSRNGPTQPPEGYGYNYGPATNPWTQGHLDTGPYHFATGGSFTVGGAGGTDSQLVQFMATPNEKVTVETPGQQSANNGGTTVQVSMIVHAKDAESFNLSRKTMVMALQSEIQRAVRSMS